MAHDEIVARFGYHPATPLTGPQHDHIRAVFAATAQHVLDCVPVGRHQNLALTALQEAMMWSNAAIACDTKIDTSWMSVEANDPAVSASPPWNVNP